MPNAARAVAQYRERAEGYDASAKRTMGLRRRTVAALHLAPGDSVLDVACGTGLSFPLLVAAVGPAGRVTGVELSPAMARLGGAFDAVLVNFAHDVLQSPQALAKIFAAAKPGARVAVSGSKFLPWWLAPANVVVRRMNAPYVTTFAGMRRPWRYLTEYVPNLQVRSALWGAGYLGFGSYAAGATA